MHEARIELVVRFRNDFADAFLGEDARHLVIDVSEADLVILGFDRGRNALESDVEAIKRGEKILKESFCPVFDGIAVIFLKLLSEIVEISIGEIVFVSPLGVICKRLVELFL